MTWKDWLADKLGWILGTAIRTEVKAEIEKRAGGGEPAGKAPTAGKSFDGRAGKILSVLAVFVLVATVACAPFLEGLARGLGGGPPVPTEEPPVSAVTPTPTPPATCPGGQEPIGRRPDMRYLGVQCPPDDKPRCGAAVACDCWTCQDSHGSCLWSFEVCQTPAPTATPAPPSPTATPTSTPTATHTATPTAEPTATPSASPAPTPWPAGYFCALDHAPWLWPPPPTVPVPVLSTAQCKPGFGGVGADRNGRQGCSIDWPKRSDQQGRTPAEGMHSSLIYHHVIIDPVDGMVRDVDNGWTIGEDRYGRHVANGQLVDEPGKPWWDGEYAHPVWCEVDSTVPTPAPTATPPPIGPAAGCSAVEAVEHWMAPGNKCHGGDAGRCVVDSTIRPICDRDHLENYTTFCGNRDHDPPYDRPEGAQLWTVEGAEDLGPNGDPEHPDPKHDNYAQRVISGAPGAHVRVTVCIKPDAKTPDGCRITRRGNGCDSREFDLPGGQALGLPFGPALIYPPEQEPPASSMAGAGDAVFILWLVFG